MNSGQQRWEQARDNTARAMEAAQGGNDRQAWHDKTYQAAMDARLGGRKATVRDDVEVCQGMLKSGAQPTMLQKSVARHSPNMDKLDDAGRQRLSRDMVAVAAKHNAEEAPREDRQNVKPGHETQRGQDHAMAAWLQKNNWSR